MQDTIFALSTPAGSGAIGVVRVSGAGAAAIARMVFRGTLRDHELTVGTLIAADGNPIDHCMAVLMRAPRSYTREDVLELHCHGGAVVVREALAACAAAGARPAHPGEFTRRAYLNGRIDMSQAQAVMDMISANSAAAARASLERMKGGLSRKIGVLEDRLLDILAELTAYLDYPDEDLEPVAAEKVRAAVSPFAAELREAIDRAPMGRRTLEGVRVAIAGAPNAGKSSLLNALLDHDRAIVTDIPGTTRDTLTEAVQIGGVAMLLTDTAGLRDAADAIERIGVERAREAIERADVLLLCVDASEPLPLEAARHLDDPRALLVLNKSDLPSVLTPDAFAGRPSLRCLLLSTHTGEGMDTLRAALHEKAEVASPEEALLTHESDVASATRAYDALIRSQDALDGLSLDCAALDLQDALDALREITGTREEALLDRVFSTFCLGK